jgi:hypothetical protein
VQTPISQKQKVDVKLEEQGAIKGLATCAFLFKMFRAARTVAHVCSPSYAGGSLFKDNPGK